MAQICKTIIAWIWLTFLVDLCLISEVATKNHQLIAMFVSTRHTHPKASSQFLPEIKSSLDWVGWFFWFLGPLTVNLTPENNDWKLSKSPPQKKSAWVTLPETNIAPFYWGLEDYFPSEFRPIFRGFCCSFYREWTFFHFWASNPKNGMKKNSALSQLSNSFLFRVLGTFPSFRRFRINEEKKIRRKKRHPNDPVPKVPNAARDSSMSLIPWKTWWPWKSSTLHRFFAFFFLGVALPRMESIVRFW